MDVVEDGPVVHGDEEEEEDEAVPDGDDDEDNVIQGPTAETNSKQGKQGKEIDQAPFDAMMEVLPLPTIQARYFIA